MGSYLRSRLPADHPVLSKLPNFLQFTVDCAEKRLLRMGVLLKPFAELGAFEKAACVAEAYGTALVTRPLRLLPRKRLTDTYLRDPAVLRERQSSRPGRQEGDG